MKQPNFPESIPRPDWVMNLGNVLAFTSTVTGLIETPYQQTGEAVSDRIGDLVMLYPTSCAAIASAKWHRDELLKHTYETMIRKAKENDEEAIKLFKSTSILKSLAESRVAELNALLALCERLNSAITHTVEAMRSVLSNLKAERAMMNQNY